MTTKASIHIHNRYIYFLSYRTLMYALTFLISYSGDQKNIYIWKKKKLNSL